MLRMVVSVSAEAAKRYFVTGFARQDYYSEGQNQEVIGNWGGRGAEMLGLHGKVDAKAYADLCDNINPVTGERLTQRTKAKRRVGYDLNFHVSKSVSVLHAFTGDERIVAAFREAVCETMTEMEKQMRTRVRQNGANSDRLTQNLIWAEFIHFLSRPVDGIPDPHLHMHVYNFNSTFDPVEKCWKAGQFGDIKIKGTFYETDFHNRLCRKLKELGYRTVKRGRSFEIEGIPQSVLEKLSRRTKLIEQLAKTLGITDVEAKAKLGAATREKKNKDITPPDILGNWRNRLTPEELAAVDTACRPKQGLHLPESTLNERSNGREHFANGQLKRVGYGAEEAAIRFALRHSFERASAISEFELLQAAIQFGMGDVELETIRERLAMDRPDVIRKEVNGRPMITTPEVLAEEEFIVRWTRRGQGIRAPLVKCHEIQDTRLTPEQALAVKHILESRDRVTGIQGRAGAGKTTLMTETINAITAAGHPVMVLAPAGRTAHEVLRAEGFSNADTVEQFLTNTALQEATKNGVIWVDEAGQVSVRTMYRLFMKADELGARVVLSGDIRQHRSVDRGDAFRVLQKFADLPVANVETIQRQKGMYRSAVEDFAAGRVMEGMEKLQTMGALREADAEDRYPELAAEYVKAVRDGASVVAIAPTHSECRRVTLEIRSKLARAGYLQKERSFQTLRRIDLTEAEREDWRTYRPGWIIEMVKSAPRCKPGERYLIKEVSGVDGGTVLVQSESTGLDSFMDVERYANRFQVYEPDEIPIAIGERIRVTKNGWSDKRKMYNGSIYVVEGFTDGGEPKLNNGAVLPRDFKHFGHGYTATSYSVQGLTADRVLIAQSSQSFGASSLEQFYVSISRGKFKCVVYTDSIEALMDAVQASSQRTSALEMMEKMGPPDHFVEIQRAQKQAEERTTRTSERLAEHLGKNGKERHKFIEKTRTVHRNARQNQTPELETGIHFAQ
ncbi:MAG: MobF family relaxase [Phycisphaerae bacterium]